MFSGDKLDGKKNIQWSRQKLLNFSSCKRKNRKDSSRNGLYQLDKGKKMVFFQDGAEKKSKVWSAR